MKRNYWKLVATAALAGMYFLPRAAYSLEVAVPKTLPLNPIIVPTMPGRNIPGPFENGRPMIKLPNVPSVVPTLPFPVRVAPASIIKHQVPQQPKLNTPVPAVPKVLADAVASEKGAGSAELNAGFDNSAARETDESVVIVVDARKKKRTERRQMLPESELELEIGIFQ